MGLFRTLFAAALVVEPVSVSAFAADGPEAKAKAAAAAAAAAAGRTARNARISRRQQAAERKQQFWLRRSNPHNMGDLSAVAAAAAVCIAARQQLIHDHSTDVDAAVAAVAATDFENGNFDEPTSDGFPVFTVTPKTDSGVSAFAVVAIILGSVALIAGTTVTLIFVCSGEESAAVEEAPMDGADAPVADA